MPPAAFYQLPTPPLSTRLRLITKNPTLKRATRLRDCLAAKKAYSNKITRVQTVNCRKMAEYL
jgi:hypothetical protein